MRTIALFATAVIAVSVFAGTAQAMSKSEIAALLDRAGKASTLHHEFDWKNNILQIDFCWKNRNYDFSVVRGEKSSTLDMFIADANHEGTSDSMGDWNIDGNVDHGDDMAARKFFSFSHKDVMQGGEWRNYWQSQYDAALVSLKSYLDHPPKKKGRC
jgi:hypothetical protein